MRAGVAGGSGSGHKSGEKEREAGRWQKLDRTKISGGQRVAASKGS